MKDLKQIQAIFFCLNSSGPDGSQQHQADQKLGHKDKEGCTLLLAMRSWEFEAFAALRR